MTAGTEKELSRPILDSGVEEATLCSPSPDNPAPHAFKNETSVTSPCAILEIGCVCLKRGESEEAPSEAFIIRHSKASWGKSNVQGPGRTRGNC